MRGALATTGLGFIIILGGSYILSGRSAAPSNVITNNPSVTMSSTSSTLTLSSLAFHAGESIPQSYTCDAGGIHPPLTIGGVPEHAKSMALIMDDPDVPKVLKPDGVFDHWILFNIPPTTREVASGRTVGIPGKNSAGTRAYVAPCPPPQYEPSEHRYVFKLYALDRQLSLSAGASRADVENAMQGHIIGEAQLVGKYKRQY